MDSIFDAAQWIVDWLNTGIYGFVEECFQELTAWLVVAKVKMMIFMVHYSWGVASVILENFQVGQYLQSAYGSLDSRLLGYLNFFRLPDSINLVVQAYATRFVLNFLGF